MTRTGTNLQGLDESSYFSLSLLYLLSHSCVLLLQVF